MQFLSDRVQFPVRRRRPNRYEQWVEAPGTMRRGWPEAPGFSPVEVLVARAWSQAQAPWGLRAVVQENAAGQPHLLEIYGAPDHPVPDWIVYPVASGLQTDEFSGESSVHGSLHAALSAIAPLS